MKRILALFLVIGMCLSFAACGEKTPTKEELLEVAEEVKAVDMHNNSMQNIVSAKEMYCNKTLLINGIVREIKENYIILSGSFGSEYVVDVYLATEEIVKLQKGQSITVVGNITDEISETSNDIGEYTINTKHYQMPVAYLESDTIELTGLLKGVNNSYAPAFNISINDSNVYMLIYFADSVDISVLKYNQEIKFSAKVIIENNILRYYDAEIIE